MLGVSGFRAFGVVVLQLVFSEEEFKYFGH